MTSAAINATGISKRFADHIAVHSLDLSVPKGMVYGLLGPNGAGKTTTIRMLLNIIAPDSGAISILGLSSMDPSLSERIGYLPEERGLYRKMQVRRVLRFLGELKGLSGRDLDARIDRWLERLSLRGAGADWGNHRVDELSRGMQQKVQFIGALIHDPDLVILDEPFSGLDPINAQALQDTILELRQQGRTIIFSTHLMDNAERLCDAVCIIAGGRKIVDGPLSEVRENYGGNHVAIDLSAPPSPAVEGVLSDTRWSVRANQSNRKFELDLPDAVDPAILLRALLDANAGVERFERVQPSLHQIFVEKVSAANAANGANTADPVGAANGNHGVTANV